MKKKNLIDIILPNYNSYSFLKTTINSVIKQSFKSWRLLIIDDCSNKKTINLLKRYSNNKKIKIVFLKKNIGPGPCRNIGLKLTKAKYVAFLDSDDFWVKNKLEEQFNFMEEKNVFFSYTAYKLFGLKNKIIKPPAKFNFEEFIKNTTIATSTIMIRKIIIKNTLFSSARSCDDYSFKCEILKKIKYAYCLNKLLTKYRIRNDSIQQSKLRNLYWVWKMNRTKNKLNFFKNLNSIIFISINSLKKYGFK